jgi:hypothetical protein
MRMTCVWAITALALLALAACDGTSGVSPTPDPATTIRRAKDYAETLPSPPRLAQHGFSRRDTDYWPDQEGSVPGAWVNQCGGGEPTATVAVPPTEGRQATRGTPPPCQDSRMTLTTTLLLGAGATTDVIFSIHWTGPKGEPRQHRWQIRVPRDGPQTLVQEAGDPLPYVPL